MGGRDQRGHVPAPLRRPHRPRTPQEPRKTVAALLDAERGEAFQAAFEAAEEELAEVRSRRARGAAVFVSPERGRSRSFRLAQPVTIRLAWDTNPYVCPLARFVDDDEDVAIVLVDGQRASIHHVADADTPRRAPGSGKAQPSSGHVRTSVHLPSLPSRLAAGFGSDGVRTAAPVSLPPPSAPLTSLLHMLGKETNARSSAHDRVSVSTLEAPLASADQPPAPVVEAFGGFDPFERVADRLAAELAAARSGPQARAR